MEKKRRFFYFLLITSTLVIVSLATVFYVNQLNRTISDHTIRSISEIALHDKEAIETYIETCWGELEKIQERFRSYHCGSMEELETKIDLECASSSFTHLYLVADDGTVYADRQAACEADSHILDRDVDFLSYFADGRGQVVARFDDEDMETSKENILYGIRLDNYDVGGVKMSALIGLSGLSSIKDRMVIDSFVKDGNSRGHSALIDKEGNYIVNINKEIFLNKRMNLYEHLLEAADSELTNEEVEQKLLNRETFGFYHTHVGEDTKELFYFMPFEPAVDLYFIMSVNEEVFTEQSRVFVRMSMAMLAVCIVTVIGMLLLVMRYQIKTIRTTEKARSQKEFLSNMSHEIRTPLNGLIGLNHLILSRIDDDGQRNQIRDWLKKSDSTANYLLSLVNDILDMSKLQAGKVDLINEPMLISVLMDEIAAMQADNIESRGVEFIVEKELTEPCIEGDATRIKQILMNIVGNAAKFTLKGGRIRFSVRQEKIDARHVNTIYCCEDTGIGMSREYMGRIFDSFSQERGRNGNGMKGTGLGMAISKLLANAMGGDITVESELDVGSTFTVVIPSLIVEDLPEHLKDGMPEMLHKNHDASGDDENICSIKILVAEDVELNAEVLIEILEMEGFETAHAANGREAVELFSDSSAGEFGVILMDMQMPVMDGCAAARAIRKLDREDAASVLIYACTANTFQEDRDLALESGMNDFLTKPIDVDILLKKMKKCMRNQNRTSGFGDRGGV